MSLQKGIKAPAFTLPDQFGDEHSLSDYRGQWIVLYFYPKDDTPGCTKEACSFRDNLDTLIENNVVVLGISKDTTVSHKKFAEKYDLNFTLLSDESIETIKAYEAWGKKKFMGKEYDGIFRTTYLIDPDGVIQKIYEKVKPEQHAEEILEDIEKLQ